MTLADEVLSRHLEAASLLAGLESSSQQSIGSPGQDDARALAAQQLLTRQAHLLVKLHTVWAAEKAGAGTLLSPSPDKELLQSRLDDLAGLCMSAFYAYRFDQLPYHWRHIYTDTLILRSHLALLQEGSAGQALRDERAIDLVVESLDRALITAGGAGVLGKRWIEGTLALLERGVMDAQGEVVIPGDAFSTEEPHGRPLLSEGHECPRHRGWGLADLETYMLQGEGEGEDGPRPRPRPRPIVFTDLMEQWPALGERPWKTPGYLLSQTLGGKRLVPVELGRSYVDAGWGQELIPFKTFLSRYVLLTDSHAGSHAGSNKEGKEGRTGYLAQHDLFRQIPALRRDILIPDLCWASVPGHPDRAKDNPPLDAPQLNAWFGPARTITPLHTDGYHNLLCQVVGTKYVRLYPPGATGRLRPKGSEHGVDMSNTSEIDVGVLEGWDEGGGEKGDEGDEGDGGLGNGGREEWREALRGVEYWECVLGPGDALLIPIGWWHYVRSLSTSFSVSFWWN